VSLFSVDSVVNHADGLDVSFGSLDVVLEGEDRSKQVSQVEVEGHMDVRGGSSKVTDVFKDDVLSLDWCGLPHEDDEVGGEGDPGQKRDVRGPVSELRSDFDSLASFLSSSYFFLDVLVGRYTLVGSPSILVFDLVDLRKGLSMFFHFRSSIASAAVRATAARWGPSVSPVVGGLAGPGRVGGRRTNGLGLLQMGDSVEGPAFSMANLENSTGGLVGVESFSSSTLVSLELSDGSVSISASSIRE